MKIIFSLSNHNYLKYPIIIFEVQKKRSNEKLTRRQIRKISFQVTKRFALFCFFFGPLLLSNLITFLFLIHLKQFKVLQERHLKSYKSHWNSNSNKTTENELSGCLRIGFVMFNSVFLEFLTPFTLGGHSFLISNLFSTILSVLDAQRGF